MTLPVLLNITYAAAIGLSLYSIGWLLHRGNKNQVTGFFILCQALMILWCFTQFFTFLQMNSLQQLVVYDVSYFGICLIGPTWFLFSLCYVGKKVSLPCMAAVYAPFVLHYSILLTNPFHHLFYRVFQQETVIYGPFFYSNAFLTYLSVLAGAVNLCLCLKGDPANRRQLKAVVLSVAVPMGCNLLYLAGFLAPGFDITPPAFSVTSILLLLATYRYNFLNVNTLATNQVYETISEGIIIYNTAGKITCCNRVAKALFQLENGDDIRIFYDRIRKYDPEAAREERDSCGDCETVLKLEDGRTVEMKKQFHFDRKGRMTAGTVILSDVSKYYELVSRTKELAVSNEQLAVEQERNRIAQDVHDTTGHTLTMIRSLMKLAEIECQQENYSHIKEYLEQAGQLSGDGIRELRCSINNLKQAGGRELVTQGIRRLAERVKELEVEVCVQGTDSRQYSHLTKTVYECAREAITNCLKYAHATHMDIILKFHEDSLDLYIFDNGRGCGKIISGNGLEGMEKRVKEAGGQFRAVSSEGEGFQITVKLPVSGGAKEI